MQSKAQEPTESHDQIPSGLDAAGCAEVNPCNCRWEQGPRLRSLQVQSQAQESDEASDEIASGLDLGYLSRRFHTQIECSCRQETAFSPKADPSKRSRDSLS